MKSLSRVQLFATPWTIAYQAPPSMGFSRQEYWSGVPLPSPLVPWPGIKPGPSTLEAWGISQWTTREVLSLFFEFVFSFNVQLFVLFFFLPQALRKFFECIFINCVFWSIHLTMRCLFWVFIWAVRFFISISFFLFSDCSLHERLLLLLTIKYIFLTFKHLYWSINDIW